MDASTLLTLTQTIIQVISSSFVNEVGSLWSFQSQVDRLKDTIDIINAVLLDAEEDERQQVRRRNVERVWFGKLKAAVYEADDLFDEIAYAALRKQGMSGNKLSKEVRLFLSRCNQLVFAFNASRDVKKIREKVDDIAKNCRDFGIGAAGGVEGRIVTKRRDDSHSYVNIEDVIGRDEDKKMIMDMLLDYSVHDDVFFVTIVGIGGLGKTTLAQLIYNDEEISVEFSLKLWVCVYDEFDVKAILCKILGSTANKKFEMEEVQRRVREKIKGKKYLLVLDDIWNEDRDKWLQLREVLIGGEKGSKVIVTTRSKIAARIIGGGCTYELKGLSEEDSWHLFQRVAFQNEEEKEDADLIDIGKNVLSRCANVPLAIRVIGSLLYGQSKNRWLSFRNRDLTRIDQDDRNGVLPILKLSYHHLASPLKSCFLYCALFPKDYRIEKEVLISLWRAHSFIAPVEGQSVEEAGEEYFMILVQRCFFQDIERNYYGEIVSCKVHDLMLDVAQEVAGTDILAVNAASQLTGKIRHLAFSDVEVNSIISSLGEKGRLRTFYRLLPVRGSAADTRLLFSKARYLRVLCLRLVSISSIPTIENLVHLRYLDLSSNDKLRFLPASVCNLINLQTLNLEGCWRLKKLPRHLSKLVNLRELNNSGCCKLTSMPPQMSSITSLCRLPEFVVRCGSSPAREGQLEDLVALTNIRGSLEIRIISSSTVDVPKVKVSRYIKDMIHLKDIKISFIGITASEAFLEGLHPPPNLREFNLSGYVGDTFPDWESSDNFDNSLPLLVKFCISTCSRLQHLPLLSCLCHLRTLELYKLDNLEYIENSWDAGNTIASSASATSDQLAFFPLLERLVLEELPKLKGWRRPSSGSAALSCSQGRVALSCSPYSFPRLSFLEINCCPYLTSIPLSSNLKDLNLQGVRDNDSSPSLFKSCSYDSRDELTLYLHDNLKSLSIVELFRSNSSSSLHRLIIRELTALEYLRLCGLDDMEETEDDNLNHHELPWSSLHENLRGLYFHRLTNLVSLPRGIQYLTSLQSLQIMECDRLEVLPECISSLVSLQGLYISRCQRLKSLPEAMHDLTSLRDLWIAGCPSLTRRCIDPTGEDWPKIQHIPGIHIL